MTYYEYFLITVAYVIFITFVTTIVFMILEKIERGKK